MGIGNKPIIMDKSIIKYVFTVFIVVSCLAVVCLGVAGLYFSHRIETVRSIFISIMVIICFLIACAITIKILVLEQDDLVDKADSENTTSVENYNIFNKKWMLYYVPY